MTFGTTEPVEFSIALLGSGLDPEDGLTFERDNVIRIEDTRWTTKMQAILTGEPDFEVVSHGGDGEDLPRRRVKTEEIVIEVDIGLIDRIVETGKQLNAVHAGFAGVGGALLAAIGWIWKRRAAKPVARADQQSRRRKRAVQRR